MLLECIPSNWAPVETAERIIHLLVNESSAMLLSWLRAFHHRYVASSGEYEFHLSLPAIGSSETGVGAKLERYTDGCKLFFIIQMSRATTTATVEVESFNKIRNLFLFLLAAFVKTSFLVFPPMNKLERIASLIVSLFKNSPLDWFCLGIGEATTTVSVAGLCVVKCDQQLRKYDFDKSDSTSSDIRFFLLSSLYLHLRSLVC